MARVFSLSTFFRMVPHSLLKRLFETLKIDTQEIPWEFVKNRDSERFFKFFRELPPEQQDRLEGVCRDVFELACGTGLNALCQTAEDHNESGWFSLSSEKTNTYAKSLWSWLEYPMIFQKALEFHKIEHLSLWRKRDGLPRKTPEWNHEIKKSLETTLQTYFTEKQGRGQVCTVMMQNYREDVYHFIAYPDDYVRNFTHHSESGQLITRKTRPTFEIVYVYNGKEGTLELHAKGGDKTKAALEDIFVSTIFGQVPDFADQIYDLSVFKEDSFTLTPDPCDNIIILLKEITLDWADNRKITFKTEKHNNTLDWVRRSIEEEELSWDEANATHVKIQILILPDEYRRRGSMTFEIAAPNKCTLRNQDEARIALARKYLKKWGVEDASTIAKKAA